MPTTVPANSREVHGVHGRLDHVVSSVSFEEGFDRVLVDCEHAEEDVEEVDDGASVVSGVEDPVQEETVPLDLPEVRDNSPHIREAFRRMDRVDVENMFRRRAVVMKTIPFFLQGHVADCVGRSQCSRACPPRPWLEIVLVVAPNAPHQQRKTSKTI